MRTTLTAFDPLAIAIGRDGRNRVMSRPFASRTGRNQPSAKASLLGTAAWVRHLIKPKPGTSLALIDWSQQEFGIAAALSKDANMQRAYNSGDAYFGFAAFARSSRNSSSEDSRADMRERFKACALGVQYGMGARTLASQLGVPEAVALELIRSHKAAFPNFWRWSDDIEAHALLGGRLQTVWGWQVLTNPQTNPRFLRNFPMQANAAEMLRWAACLITEAGIKVCATLHDAFLIEARTSEIEDAVSLVQKLMSEASEVVLDGFALRSDAKIFRYPGRYHDPRGDLAWRAILTVLEARRNERPARRRDVA